VIASKADKANNRLDTDTIGFTDIKNKAEFEVDSIGMAGGTSHTDGNPKPNGGMPSIYEHDDKTSNITHSAISEGELIIRDTDKQIQDINELSHDTEQAHHKLNPIFDKEKEQTRQEIVTGLKDLGALVKELKDAMDKQNNHGNENKMGSDFNKGVDSAIAIVTGMMTGDISGGLAGASAPWLAEQIKIHAGDNEVARLTAHAILAGTIAELQGNSGLAGGAGAVSGELAAEVIRNLYKDDNGKKKNIKDLTEAEKQNISALSQLAAGLAAASMGGDVGDIGASIAASKNAVENNFLGPIDQERLMELRDKRDKKFLSREEKIEMFLLDELDQKGDYLVGKYYKDPNSLTDEQVQRLMESLTRYYQQEEGMIGEEAAKRAVNDLLTGNWGYRAHNYDYPYLSYPEHKELYIDAYWDSIANKSFLEKLFSARPQDENEQYFNKEKAWQKYMEATEWEQQVGRPVMNFLPGGVGLVYNTMDTLESANALSDVNRRLNNGEEFNTEMALKLTDAGLTFVPVAGSRLMSKGGTKGTVGGIFNTSALNPNEIRFSQNTVSYNKVERGTDMKYTYDDIVTSMKTNGWKGDPVDVIKMPDGKFTSMDNTRIAAAREAGIDIKANIRNFYDKLSPAEVNRFSDPKKGFVPVTWGDAITGRINKQSGGFSKNNPYGSSTPPRISGKPKD
jgi:uncharacterized protein YoxC